MIFVVGMGVVVVFGILGIGVLIVYFFYLELVVWVVVSLVFIILVISL